MSEVRRPPTGTGGSEELIRSAVFADPRGQGRSMRVTHHPVAGVAVFSQWHDDRCISTFRLPVADADRLIALLAQALGEPPPLEPSPAAHA
jgi:hypothetical protein